jgi:DNA-binding HxlR family transcriptional regulator
MAKQKGFADSPCPVARAVDLIGDRWSLLILRDAFDGMRRFGDFRQSLGVASNILSDRLKALVEAGIFESRQASDGSAYLEYSLTKKGEDFFPVVVMLRQWGEANLFLRGERHSLLVEQATGKPLPRQVLYDKAGHPIRHSETEVRKIA